MLRLKKLLLFFVMLAMVGCAGGQRNLTLVSTAGERIPHPFYTAKTTGNKDPMSFIWYYAKWQGMEDVDGTVQTFPTYLDRKQEHHVASKTTLGMDMVLRVFNPTLKEYQVYINKNVRFQDGSGYGHRIAKGSSFMEYREWRFHFATSERVDEAEFNIEVVLGETTVLRTERFKYFVN